MTETLPQKPARRFKRVLEPQERIAEVLFGLIMVLTFTGSLSIAEAGRDDVRTMLIGALGCNLAWGVIDGVLYLMAVLADRGRDLQTYRAVRATDDPARAQQLIAGALPPLVASVVEPGQFQAIHQRLRQLDEPPRRAWLGKADLLGALGVFLLVFFTTLPVAVPFVLMDSAQAAMRVSNAIAVALLFVAGFMFGRIVGGRAWLVGGGMVLLGCVLVAITIRLGG